MVRCVVPILNVKDVVSLAVGHEVDQELLKINKYKKVHVGDFEGMSGYKGTRPKENNKLPFVPSANMCTAFGLLDTREV